MRSPRRSASPRSTRALTARPRAGVAGPVAELRRGREALTAIEGQLDAILHWLGNPAAGLAADAPDRLASAAHEAGEALAALGRLRGVVADLY